MTTDPAATPSRPTPAIHHDHRWQALGLLCLGVLMIVLDTTIVNVALPSIRADLKFTDAALAWVVNAYMLTYGGFLLLGGRLGDLYGHRRLFLAGIAVFTLASLACGLAGTQGFLIAARAVQGLGGAVVSAVSLSLIMDLFTEPADRARAMGVYGFVCAGGGSLGAMLGGLLTGSLSWHWVFLVNLPIGLGVIALSLKLLPAATAAGPSRHLDVAGAVTVTVALMLAVYAIVNGNEVGWTAARTLVQLAVAAALLALFLAIEARVRVPLMPLRLFRLRNVAVANVVGVLWAAAMFAWFFLSALYMQLVLGYRPLEVGLAFLPANLIMALFSLGLSAKLVMRFGIRRPLAAGLSMAVLGLLLFARAPVAGHFVVDVLPGMLLLGLGAGIAFNPLLLAAMSDVEPAESGLASGVVNTAFMMGGALGLAVLASLAAARSEGMQAQGQGAAAALTAGYEAAFLVGAVFAAVAAGLGAWLLRVPTQAAATEAEPAS
ncbi:DHA2 family efflux MFS transporter permease subunit [Frateuria defendens]|uniref:DHA2 family efflux MFS transporter permease subunit n=1 Tax=Frateuria defendens TaxID=2219559 RepID=UPI00066FD768|nr:DHA2 family efflux MFS transporter permease subunit [Frateuria defendens]